MINLPFLPSLLHRANSYPGWCDKEAFYELKTRILTTYAVADGFDVQHFPGKDCWSCDNGTFYHTYSGDPDVCHRCGGLGWYDPPRWVQLPRWKFGKFVFHSIGKVVFFDKKHADEWGEPAERFEGFLEHREYSYRQQKRAHLLLGLVCDWSYFSRCVYENWRWSWAYRFLNQRCVDCRCHTFPVRRGKWRCKICERVRQRTGDDIPF